MLQARVPPMGNEPMTFTHSILSGIVCQLVDIKNTPSLASFKRKLKTFLFNLLRNKCDGIIKYYFPISDTGILAKWKSECSYQESNLRPSDY